jgi:hypothetical protein
MKLQDKLHERALRSPADLESDSKTLRYELGMLVGLAQGYSTPAIQADRIATNAYVESFAVHCRALIFFLFGHLKEITANGSTENFSCLRKTDVLAFDFHREWQRDCPQPTEAMVKAKWQADKHVAHITTDRREVNQPGSDKESVWNLIESVTAICNTLTCFLSKAPPLNFNAIELQRIQDLITEWEGLITEWDKRSVVVKTHSLPESASPVDPVTRASVQAKTEAPTLSPHVGFNMHGKTE